MIYDYEIKNFNGEDTLVLYFDFNSEFAKKDGKENRRKLREIIGDFVKENKIDFKGKKVAIISGGLLMGTLLFNSPVNQIRSYRNEMSNTYNTVMVLEDNEIVPELPIIKEEVEKPEVIGNSEIQIEQNNSSNVNKNETVNNNVNLESKIYVNIIRANGSIQKLELEEYVIGVVGAEMPASFEMEALKVQAILARTYAMKSVEKGLELTDNSSTQNYKSNDELKRLWGANYNKYYQKIKNAVESTKGMCVTYNEKLIEAVYHSTSNGKTENAEFVWGNFFPYLESVSSPYDMTNKSFYDKKSISYQDISNKLGIDLDMNSNIEIVKRTVGERVEIIKVNEQTFTGVEIRKKLGLRSADFEIEKTELGWIVTTRGFGHGVGLSQYGANGMAKNGDNFQEIIKHYYKGVSIDAYV